MKVGRMAVISYVTNVFLTVNKKSHKLACQHLWQIELVWPLIPNAWSNLNCLPDFTMVSVDARVLFSYNAACCGDLQYWCNSRNGFIYFIATDVDFNAAFVKNMCWKQNLCRWSFLNLLYLKWGVHTPRANFLFLPAIAYEISSIVGEFTHTRCKLIHEVDNKNNLTMQDLILTVVLLRMQPSEVWASDSVISVKNQVLELMHPGTYWSRRMFSWLLNKLQILLVTCTAM